MSALRCASQVRRIINFPLGFTGKLPQVRIYLCPSLFYLILISRWLQNDMTKWTSIRHSSFKSSEVLTPEEQNRISQKNIEILTNPPEWKYVERLLGNKIIPPVNVEGDGYMPCGWRPQKSVEELKNKFPYFINRTKNHQIPVYLMSTFRGHRKITKLKRVEGDIWALEADIKKMLETTLKKRIETRVNEVSGQIDFKGIHVDMISEYLMEQGF